MDYLALQPFFKRKSNTGDDVQHNSYLQLEVELFLLFH